LNMAKLCQHNNDTTEAIFFYQQVIKLDPDFEEAFVNLARIYLEKRDLNSAINVLNKALNSGHKVEPVLILLGIVNAELGLDAKAGYYFSELLKIGLKSQEAMLNIGIFYANHGQLNKAIEFWQEGLRNAPGNKILKENIDRAKELLRQGR
jgi:tetratricopeptide (TPR) repeat protein